MEKKKIVEVIEDFPMVRPGEVYESIIKEGEKVEGRVAEVALLLDKGIERDPEAEGAPDPTTIKTETKTEPNAASEAAKDGQGSLLAAGASVPGAKAGLKGEVNSEGGTGK